MIYWKSKNALGTILHKLDEQEVQIILNWLKVIIQPTMPKKVFDQAMAELNRSIRKETKHMVSNFPDNLKRWRNEALKEGRDEGIKHGRREGLRRGVKQGMKRGMEQGLREGMENSRREIARNMLKRHISPQVVAEITELPYTEVINICSELTL